MYKNYIPAHSDYLIHWTGKDIENELNSSWTDETASMASQELSEIYINRLKNILKHGLWMTKNEEDKEFKLNGNTYRRPWTARTCFTELKLSNARSHAADYGRLGIGFKRFFLFDRLGAPMIYYHESRNNHIVIKDKDYSEEYYACFFKHMTLENSSPMIYKYLDESEWRIIYSDEIMEKLLSSAEDLEIYVPKTFIHFSNLNTAKKKEIVGDSSMSPEYLIPIDGKWLALIIYPSLTTKVMAEKDPELRKQLRLLTKSHDLDSNIEGKPGPYEKYSNPIELDLDACRNF